MTFDYKSSVVNKANDQSHPLVSICTPTRDRPEFLSLLEECILGQDYPREKIQWVIVDNSREKNDIHRTTTLLNIKYIKLEGVQTIAQMRNECNLQSDGEIIVCMDDDDFYPSTRISHSVGALQNSKRLVAGCSALPVLYIEDKEMWLSGPFAYNHATANTLAYKKELLELTHFNENETYGEERYFLHDYRIPMIQLDPAKTIIHIAHSTNTIEKQSLKKEEKSFKRLDDFDMESINNVVDKYTKAAEDSSQKIIEEAKNDIEIKTYKGDSPWKSLNLENIYCISLPESKKRREGMREKMLENGLDINFELATNEFQLPSIKFSHECFNSNRELACLASHLKIIKKIKDQHNAAKESYYMILEDDVILRKKFNPIPITCKAPKDWEIIQLGTHNNYMLGLLYKYRLSNYEFIEWSESSYGTFAYLINIKAVNKIVDRFMAASSGFIDFRGLFTPGKYTADYLIYDQCKTYICCNTLATEDSRYRSTIAPTCYRRTGEVTDVMRRTMRMWDEKI